MRGDMKEPTEGVWQGSSLYTLFIIFSVLFILQPSIAAFSSLELEAGSVWAWAWSCSESESEEWESSESESEDQSLYDHTDTVPNDTT